MITFVNFKLDSLSSRLKIFKEVYFNDVYKGIE